MTYVEKMLKSAEKQATRAAANCYTQRQILGDLCVRIDRHVAQGLAQSQPEPDVGHDDDTVPVSQAELVRRLRISAKARR